ncbi:hypothetical protein NQZ68_017176 [Dissostichus eleginoides]|nr:hypothetical protein NQZ68_017176 [Dissostichus eleginoides]
MKLLDTLSSWRRIWTNLPVLRDFSSSQKKAEDKPHMELSGRPLLLLLLGLQLCGSAVPDDRLISDRFGVYWNSSNPSVLTEGPAPLDPRDADTYSCGI